MSTLFYYDHSRLEKMIIPPSMIKKHDMIRHVLHLHLWVFVSASVRSCCTDIWDCCSFELLARSPLSALLILFMPSNFKQGAPAPPFLKRSVSLDVAEEYGIQKDLARTVLNAHGNDPHAPGFGKAMLRLAFEASSHVNSPSLRPMTKTVHKDKKTSYTKKEVAALPSSKNTRRGGHKRGHKTKKGGKGGKYTWHGSSFFDVDDVDAFSTDDEVGEGAGETGVHGAQDEERIQKRRDWIQENLQFMEHRFGDGMPVKKWSSDHSRPRLKSFDDADLKDGPTSPPLPVLNRLQSYEGEFDDLYVVPPQITGKPEHFFATRENEELITAMKDVQIEPVAGLMKRSSFSPDAPGGKLKEAGGKALKRVFRELKKDLPRSLDNDAWGSIFIRYDDESPAFMQALLTGGPYGPYSNGVFLFDIACDADYPVKNCQVRHVTKDAHTLKLSHSPGGFSPNLHASSGKVCLSLLGTWAGIGWSPNKSNIYQVLASLLRDVFGVAHPYYNEPNCGYWEGECPMGPTGHDTKVLACTEYIREATVRLAMIAPLKKPPKGFERAVRLHFLVRRVAIEATVGEWLKEANQYRKEGRRSKSEMRALDCHIDNLTQLNNELRRLLYENMNALQAQKSLETSLQYMDYAETSLNKLKMIGGLLTNAKHDTVPIEIERGGIIFKSEKKRIDDPGKISWDSKYASTQKKVGEARQRLGEINATVHGRTSATRAARHEVSGIVADALSAVDTTTAVGGEKSSSLSVPYHNIEEKECMVCHTMSIVNEALGCGHMVCHPCWSEYLSNMTVGNFGTSELWTFGRATCPIKQCKEIVPAEFFKELLDTDKAAYYEMARSNWFQSLKVGDCCDVQDRVGKWYEGVILEIEDDFRYKFHFKGWLPKFDEYIPLLSDRICPLNTVIPEWRSLLKVGDIIEYKTEDTKYTDGVWWVEAKVVEVDTSDEGSERLRISNMPNHAEGLQKLENNPKIDNIWESLYSEKIMPIYTHVRPSSGQPVKDITAVTLAHRVNLCKSKHRMIYACHYIYNDKGEYECDECHTLRCGKRWFCQQCQEDICLECSGDATKKIDLSKVEIDDEDGDEAFGAAPSGQDHSNDY